MSSVKSVIVGVVAGVLAAAGCGNEPSLQPDSVPVAPATSMPADRTGRMQIGPTPPPPSTLSAPATDLPPREVYTPTIAVDDVRIEVDADTGIERVVYLFAGEGIPFFRAGYVAEAVPHRGGPSLAVTGQAIMQVDIMGTATPARNLFFVAPPLAGPEGARVTQLYLLPNTRDVNGITQSFIGLRSGPRPFEVVTVEDPPQLIIEVR